jgi:hypothetical protein
VKERIRGLTHKPLPLKRIRGRGLRDYRRGERKIYSYLFNFAPITIRFRVDRRIENFYLKVDIAVDHCQNIVAQYYPEIGNMV